jgi:Ca-activated chloride channel homolog
MTRWFLIAVAALPLLADTGTLNSPKGLCPLKHTDVQARITGALARVTVTQEFENPFAEKIEAVYTFPLPHEAAVDDMTMRIGDRTIRGLIKRREEARKIFDDARRNGHLAGLLDQERPNIFTQAVTNIAPGAKVKVEISYVENVPYAEGSYEFVFPMVVAPRYSPRQVRDAARITPPITPEGTRAGHDISIEVKIEAGMPLASIASKTHEVAIEGTTVRLKDQAAIPNKDFLLRYAVSGSGVSDALLAHRDSRGGYFSLVLQPPARVAAAEVTPKELVFLLDTSGSMSGFPIEKAKETMRLAMDALDPRDTFNLITFSGDTRILFPQPVPATPENRRAAQEFLQSQRGSGGTEMMRAIRAALAPSDRQDHVRVVCFMTDGEVGNDLEIIAEVQKHPNARVFAFGIGSSVNRFLLDGVARYGRGEVEYVGLKDDGSAAARRFAERVRQPLLTDVSIDWGGLPVSEVYPARLPDLFAAKPVIVSGRYGSAASGTIRLRGKMAGRDFVREIRVNLPAKADRDVVATLWARRRVAELSPKETEEITKLGLEYRLMTPFTSFVAVEEKVVTEGGAPRRVEVPVEMPEGMRYDGIFGSTAEQVQVMASAPMMRMSGGVVGGVLPGPHRPVGGIVGQPTPPPVSLATKQIAPEIAAVIARVKSGGRPGVDEMAFVFGGAARVRLTISDVSPLALDALRKAGLTITQQTGNVVDGTVPVEKLEAVTRLAFEAAISAKR